MSTDRSAEIAANFDYLFKALPVCHAESNHQGVQSLLGVAGIPTPAIIKSRLEFPLVTIVDIESNKKFIACALNKLTLNGIDSYRSPWTNKFFPPLAVPDADLQLPSEKLRTVEKDANDLLEAYADLYYMGGIRSFTSAYFKDTEEGFEACFLVKKEVENNEFVAQGEWESVNYVTAIINGAEATYKLTTTVLINMNVSQESVGETNVSGLVTRQSEVYSKVDASKTPLSVIGRMIEDIETDIRLGLNDVHILKTKNVVNSLRSLEDAVETPSQAHMDSLNNAVLGLGLKKDTDIVGGNL